MFYNGLRQTQTKRLDLLVPPEGSSDEACPLFKWNGFPRN